MMDTRRVTKTVGRSLCNLFLGVSCTIVAGNYAHDWLAETPEEALARMGYNPALLTETATHRDTLVIRPDALGLIAITTLSLKQSLLSNGFVYALKNAESIAKASYTKIYDPERTYPEALVPWTDSGTCYISIANENIDIIKTFGRFKTPDGREFQSLSNIDEQTLRLFILLHEWRHCRQGSPITLDSTEKIENEYQADEYGITQTFALTGQDTRESIAFWRILSGLRNYFTKEESIFDHDDGLLIAKEKLEGLNLQKAKKYIDGINWSYYRRLANAIYQLQPGTKDPIPVDSIEDFIAAVTLATSSTMSGITFSATDADGSSISDDESNTYIDRYAQLALKAANALSKHETRPPTEPTPN